MSHDQLAQFPHIFAQLVASAVVQQLQTSGFAVQPVGSVPPAAPAPLPSFAPPAPAPAPAMPAPPSFAAPAPAAPAAPSLPFSDAKGLTDYTMATYKELGPVKGAQIQQIVTWLGCANVNDIRPDQYAQFVQAVEQLKAS